MDCPKIEYTILQHKWVLTAKAVAILAGVQNCRLYRAIDSPGCKFDTTDITTRC